MGSREERLHSAIRENDRSAAECLLRDGVAVDCVYYGTTPLHLAITKGYPDLAVWLLDQGCSGKVTDVQGVTAIEEAVTRDHLQIVKTLLTNGVDINQRFTSGHTALTYAALKRLTCLVQALVQAGGVDVNLSNCWGESALYLAAREGNSGIVEELLSRNDLDKDVVCGTEAITPLIAASMEDHLRTVKLLVAGGCDVNAKDGNGWTALWHAVNDSNDKLVKTLVACGSDVTVVDAEGKTIIQLATENDDDDIIGILRQGEASWLTYPAIR